MLDFISQGGQIMWILLIVSIVIIFLTIRNIIKLFFKIDPADARLDIGLNAILFWGGISAGLGIFGHFEGIYVAMQEIMKTNDTSPAIVGQGYLMSLTSIISGLVVFAFASIIWFVLRWRYNSIKA